jgi:hypothetical protein
VAADLLRPSAEEAEPHVRASDALCRVTSPRGAGSDPRLEWPPRRRPQHAPYKYVAYTRTTPRQTRWARRRVRATNNRTDQSAFHRIDPDLAIRAGKGERVVHVHDLRRTLSPAASRARLVKGWLVASGYPTCNARCELPRDARACEKDASLRLLQPTYDTSTQLDWPALERAPRRPCGRRSHADPSLAKGLRRTLEWSFA